jgi:4-diphosphocytidyl-2-C-methyl-D-erythritol kinase
MIWLAPAKLNLFLHVVGRQSDGYHLLQTVFQFLNLFDELAFRITDDGRITRAYEIVDVAPDADLTVRAARMLKEKIGGTRGVDIRLRKRIPMGGGLGGGSSDAAATLWALNELWEAGLSVIELAALGLELGADVPVFVHGRAAWAEGVGDKLTPIELPEPWYLVAVPPISVSTAAAFAEFEVARGLTPYTPARTIRDLQPGFGRNDLEPVVRHCFPEVDRALEWLSRYGRPCMTGSGGCVFVEVPDAERGADRLSEAPPGLTGFVAHGLNRHPRCRSDTGNE